MTESDFKEFQKTNRKIKTKNYEVNNQIKAQALAIFLLAEEYLFDTSTLIKKANSQELGRTSNVFSSNLIKNIYLELSPKTYKTNIYKFLNPLIKENIIIRWYWNGKEYASTKPNKYNSLLYLNCSIDSFKKIFKILYEYKEKVKPDEDPILRILETNYFLFHYEYFEDLKVNFYDSRFDSHNHPITEHSKKIRELAMDTYYSYPEYFKYLVYGKFHHNILQELFYKVKPEDKERYLKTFLEFQTILNYSPEMTLEELNSKYPFKYEMAYFLLKNLQKIYLKKSETKNKGMEEKTRKTRR